MSGVNKVILIGNLGNDPEVRYGANGNAVTNISVATSESWKDKETGAKKEQTEWHRVTFFNRLAEIVGEYLKKGSKVYIEGMLRTSKWKDKEGVEKYKTEIIASNMQMLGSKFEHKKENNIQQQELATTENNGSDDDIPF